MSEPTTIAFSFKEIAEALVRYHGLHEGIWGINVGFGVAGANVNATPGSDYRPTALVPIMAFGLRQYDEVNNLSVDAAVVNPATDAVTPTTKVSPPHPRSRRYK